jgi:hypothetical protein
MAKRKSRSQAKDAVAAAAQSTNSVPSTDAPSPKDIAFRSEPHADVPVDPSTEDTRSSSMGSEPSEEDVRMRAYQRYLDRGANHGEDFDDWLKAEEELRLSQEKARSGQ